jgi:hypothetical protein
MSTPLPAVVEMQPLPSAVSQNTASPFLKPLAPPSPPAAFASRWHSRSYYLSINLLQALAALAVAAFAVVVAGWQYRPNWAWSYLSWYFFALGGLQFLGVVTGVASVAKNSKVVLVGSLFFYTIATLAVVVTSLLMLIPAFRYSFLSSCFTPFATSEYQLIMQNFELQYCVTATVSASDFGKWAAWCLGIVGSFIQLPWIIYICSHSPTAIAADKTGSLAFNKLPQLDAAITVTPAQPAAAAAKDTSAGCGILFAPTNQSGTLQVVPFASNQSPTSLTLCSRSCSLSKAAPRRSPARSKRATSSPKWTRSPC